MIPEFTMGDRLRKARELTGKSQAEFADEIGVGRSSVQNYELGHTSPKPIALKAWALATGVPVHWLRWGMTEAPTPTPVASGAGASVGKLPRLDSNQQPAGYGPLRPVRHPDGSIQSTSDKVRRVTRPAVLPFPTTGREDLAA